MISLISLLQPWLFILPLRFDSFYFFKKLILLFLYPFEIDNIKIKRCNYPQRNIGNIQNDIKVIISWTFEPKTFISIIWNLDILITLIKFILNPIFSCILYCQHKLYCSFSLFAFWGLIIDPFFYFYFLLLLFSKYIQLLLKN